MDHSDALVAARPLAVDVEAQLHRILNSDAFRHAPKRSELLRFVVERTLSGQADTLDGRTIAAQVFNERCGFDTSRDSKVRVAANRLRLALKLYALEIGANDPVIVSMRPGSYVPEFRFAEPMETGRTAAYRAAKKTGPAEHRELMDVYWRYQSSATSEAHADAYRRFLSASIDQPDRADLHAILAELALDGHATGYLDWNESMDIAHHAIEQAAMLDRDDPQLQVSIAFAAIFEGDLAAATRAAHRLKRVENEPLLAAFGSWFEMVASPPEGAGLSCHHKLVGACRGIGWMHHTCFLDAYRTGDYELALSEAIRFGMPDFMWSTLERAAALGQLGVVRCGGREIAHLKRLNPQFANQPRRYLKCYIPYDDDAEQVLDGLNRAGLCRW
jgi:hypothetical protein